MPPPIRPRRLSSAKQHPQGGPALMCRIFGLDVLRCPKCDGRMKLVAFIFDPRELRRICHCLGLPCQPPVSAPARSPPQGNLDWGP